MMITKSSKAREASIIAMSAALYVIFFFLSYSVTLPNFTLLYLPIILLGVFPVWFGWSGLAGSIIGAFIGGAFVEGLGFLGVFECVVAIIIYLVNWTFMPKRAAEDGKSTSLFVLLGTYSISLLVGCGYILWQYTILPQLFSAEQALTILVPTFAINLPIVLITCPALLRAISPKMRNWGMYSGNFREWLSNRKARA
jgi:hypothetical protein